MIPSGTQSNQPEPAAAPRSISFLRTVFTVLITITLVITFFSLLWTQDSSSPAIHSPAQSFDKKPDFQAVVNKIDHAFEKNWQNAGISPVESASELSIIRRLSLALTGTIPSLEEIRSLEQLSEEQETEGQAIQWWITKTFVDRRWSNYVAERLARSYVGTEGGPFLVYRRRRLVDWISDHLLENRPYDQLVQNLITANGIWTSKPEVNFVTVTIDQNNDKKGPNEAKLAARVSRAFLGVRIDCMECHNDKFGDRWKQKDFHQLAAFFGEAQMSLSGIHNNTKESYQYRSRWVTHWARR